MRDFTLEKYEHLIKIIEENKISVYGVKRWQELRPVGGILLRHDVDRKPRNALKVAELERKFGIASTYYFRMTRSSFDETVIKRIYEMGNEIGYHYEDLSLAKGNYEIAEKLFHKHLEQIRAIAEVETIAMHGSPLSSYDNRDLWKKFDFADFGIVAEAYLSIDYSDIYYLTDTGRTWGQTQANIRDKVKQGLAADIRTTNDLRDFIIGNKDKKIALVMHPERWEDKLSGWIIQYFKDIGANVIKRFLKG
jgi:hypothetical protein